MSTPPLSIDDLALRDLRADLSNANYTVAAVEALLGPVAAAALSREQTVPALRVARAANGPLATLVRLFMLGDAVTPGELRAALPACQEDGATSLGLAEPSGDGLRWVAGLDLRPYSAVDSAGPIDWWLASDLSEIQTGRALAADHVLGAGGASLTLAALTVRARVALALDMGTGCGIQAMHAARHCDRVVATDISERALRFAAFNLALNGIDNVELRAGSLFEPVAGQSFDLIVSNPPFVITPRASRDIPDYEYRDGGMQGDALVEAVIGEAGAHLRPGGIAQLLVNWEQFGPKGPAWRERLGSWVPEDLDAWLVRREELDPAQYAETWLRDGGLTRDRDTNGWERAYADYIEDFEVRGVASVAMGFAVLHRPASPRETWKSIVEHGGQVIQPLGETIERGVAARTWLAENPADLVNTRFVVADDVTEERYYRPGDADPAVIMVRQGSGLCHHVNVSGEFAGLLGACDGALSIGQLIAAIAAIVAEPADSLTARLLPEIRAAFVDGILRVAN
ncbi:DUF7059 domain-containing protein [Rarobacter incanus]|uniref:Methyltransferase family protein n=1 Tax=Rarobacter incanus TaxID=153494 RepID=A0A542SP44_9MICO|nr:methyltransferase [Rarobacter incanus]TQK76401.1 methyltransferase family protein [Rarobacter incanus]